MKKHAFTLVELLVVIAIIGILIALLLPAVQAAREAARRMECTNKIKQLALASQNYHDIHQFFPGGAVFLRGKDGDAHPANYGFWWAISLLPFMEQSALYEEFNPNVGLSNNGTPRFAGGRTNAQLSSETSPNWLYCPSDPGAGRQMKTTSVTTMMSQGARTISYMGVGGYCRAANIRYGNHAMLNDYDDWMAYRGVFHAVASDFNNGTRKAAPPFESMATVLDGTSNTVCFVEASTTTDESEDANCIRWYNYFGFVSYQLIYDVRPHPMTFMSSLNHLDFIALAAPYDRTHRGGAGGSYHAGGINAAKVDGSVAFISETIDLTIWQYMVRLEDGMSSSN